MLGLLATFMIQADVPKWAPAPTSESSEVAATIDLAERELSRRTASDVLSDPRFDGARPYPRFRKLIEKHPAVGEVSMITEDEPGERLEFTFLVKDRNDRPVQGALLYFYHTDARGAYAKNGVHFQAVAGDINHARLFAYGKTDGSGRLTAKSIRPAGYPGGELPQHIHFHVLAPDGYSVSEVRFADDPRLTTAWKQRSREEGTPVVALTKAAGRWNGSVVIKPRN